MRQVDLWVQPLLDLRTMHAADVAWPYDPSYWPDGGGNFAKRYGYPRISSLSPRTSQLCNRLRKLMPSRLVRSCPGCAISAGTARSVMPPIDKRSSVTGAARARPFAVSTFTE